MTTWEDEIKGILGIILPDPGEVAGMTPGIKAAAIDTALTAIREATEKIVPESMEQVPEECESKDYALGIMAGHNSCRTAVLDAIKGKK